MVAIRGLLPHARVSAALLAHAGSGVNVTEVFSMKEYEDLCVPLPTRACLHCMNIASKSHRGFS